MLKAVILCIVIFLLLKYLAPLFSPFITAVFISIILEPVIKILMDKLSLSRKFSITIALLFFCIIFFAIIYFLIHNIYKETLSILKDIPNFYEKINYFLQKYNVLINKYFHINEDGQNITAIDTMKVINIFINSIAKLKDGIIKSILALPDIFMYITFSSAAAFFILKDRKIIIDIFKRNVPQNIFKITLKINRSIINIIKTECMLIVISTLQTITGFFILNVKYALLIGIFSGILDILPLIGPALIFIPWALYSIICGDVIFAVSLICLYIIIGITRQMLETKFISGKLDLHPLIILLSIYIGLKFFGFLGAIFGPLFALIIKMIYEESINQKQVNI